jgi:hypothetical protein
VDCTLRVLEWKWDDPEGKAVPKYGFSNNAPIFSLQMDSVKIVTGDNLGMIHIFDFDDTIPKSWGGYSELSVLSDANPLISHQNNPPHVQEGKLEYSIF